MLGRQVGQMSLAEAQLWSGKEQPLVDADSFHHRFAKVWPTLVKDEDFAHWFHPEIGRPSAPPSVVAGAFLLALREDCSDREAEQRMRYDLRWKWALGLELNDRGCDHSSLCVFRGRLLAHQEEGRLFQAMVQRAVKAGLLSKRALQVMDSSPMLGAAAVQDTYKLIRSGLHQLVKAHGKTLPVSVRARLKPYLKTGKPAIDWEDAAARQKELAQLVADAEVALAQLPAEQEKPSASAARGLLQKVARQDVETDAEGQVQLRTGVAKDRVVSTVDPDMRHGHKSAAGKWNGYKKHLSVEPETELITAVAVTAANAGDGSVALELLEQQAKAGLGAARSGRRSRLCRWRTARPSPPAGRRHAADHQGRGTLQGLFRQGGFLHRSGRRYGAVSGRSGGSDPLPARSWDAGEVHRRNLRRLQAGGVLSAESLVRAHRQHPSL